MSDKLVTCIYFIFLNKIFVYVYFENHFKTIYY